MRQVLYPDVSILATIARHGTPYQKGHSSFSTMYFFMMADRTTPWVVSKIECKSF